MQPRVTSATICTSFLSGNVIAVRGLDADGVAIDNLPSAHFVNRECLPQCSDGTIGVYWTLTAATSHGSTVLCREEAAVGGPQKDGIAPDQRFAIHVVE